VITFRSWHRALALLLLVLAVTIAALIARPSRSPTCMA
jgi:hypothetical protein